MQSKQPALLRFLLALSLAIAIGSSHEAKADFGTSDTSKSYYEVGAVIGLPALVNLAVGYWNGPALFRLTGMYYGTKSFFGFQGEFGWAFCREQFLRQYVAAIGAQIAGSRDNGLTHATMLGVMYGVNWHGLALEAGPETIIGPFDTKHGFKGGITFQAGYTLFFPSL